MKWLVDNNVPRGVTTLLLDLYERLLPAIEEAFAQRSIRVVASRRTLTTGPDTRGIADDT
jgi:hypothetical protein